jgi:hypothetical protein
MKTIIGQFASGANYFPRPNITNEIWKKLDSGSNILLVAPRRVGKTSILNYLLDNPKDNYIVIYYTSESVNSENEFYKKLYHHLIEKLATSARYKAKATNFTKSLMSRITSVGADGVEFGESRISYLDEFVSLIKNIDWKEEKIVVLIDEFAQTVENIIQDHDKNKAIHFLETKREIRQTKEIQNKLQFVYAGSIGLENIVSKVNSIDKINDLTSVNIPPLSNEEAWGLLENIFENEPVPMKREVYDYMVEIIEWLIPFYFQLLIDEMYQIKRNEKLQDISIDVVNRAVKNALMHRIYFEQWFTRLRKAYKGDEFSFLKDLLNYASESKTITANDVSNLAEKYKLESTYKELLNALKHDGYINNNDDPKIYRFNSPLLRKWWETNVAN